MAEESDRRTLNASEKARDAARRMDWETAADCFSAADAESTLDADDLESWSTASYMLGNVEAAAQVLGRAHHLHVAAGEFERALRTAFWVVFMLMEAGEVAQAGGWANRSERLLEHLPDDSIAHSYQLVVQAYQLAAIEEDYVTAEATADRVIQIARLAGDHDVEALALNLKGRSVILDGRADEGLPLLDEAMVAVVSGLLSPVVVGTVYCSLIESCEEIAELRRAQEWTDALSRWCEKQSGEIPFTAQCRIHRSKILQRRGEFEKAEEEARQAYELYTRTPYAAATGRALYQLGEVYRACGEFSAAESAYQQASEWGVDPQPGLALVRLGMGEPETAASSLRRLLSETESGPDRISLLPAYVEVMLVVGDHGAAEDAARELEDLATVFQTEGLRALAAYAEGAIRLVRRDPEAALRHLRQACAVWQDLNSPYEIARTRFLIGHACSALGDDDSAALEIGAATELFAELGLAEIPLIPVTSNEPEHDLTERELDVLRCLTSGATNRAIAEELFLSVKTIDRHVANILTKLGVPSRTAAVSFAYEHHLV